MYNMHEGAAQPAMPLPILGSILATGLVIEWGQWGTYLSLWKCWNTGKTVIMNTPL